MISSHANRQIRSCYIRSRLRCPRYALLPCAHTHTKIVNNLGGLYKLDAHTVVRSRRLQSCITLARTRQQPSSTLRSCVCVCVFACACVCERLPSFWPHSARVKRQFFSLLLPTAPPRLPIPRYYVLFSRIQYIYIHNIIIIIITIIITTARAVIRVINATPGGCSDRIYTS